ncbi:hypothetical protein FRC01_003673 [Tulasnella sp. 417]|nr:hypothetical protein FRC01_003673 [Tulasnella sp. 417]
MITVGRGPSGKTRVLVAGFFTASTGRGADTAAAGAAGKTILTFSRGVLNALAVSDELPDEAVEVTDELELVRAGILGLDGGGPILAPAIIPLLDNGGPPLSGAATESMGTFATIVPKLEACIELLANGELTTGGLVLLCLALTPPPPFSRRILRPPTPTSVELLRLPKTELARLPLGLPYPLGLTLPSGLLVPLILLELRLRSEMPEDEADRVEVRPRPEGGGPFPPPKKITLSWEGDRNPADASVFEVGDEVDMVAVGGMCIAEECGG